MTIHGDRDVLEILCTGAGPGDLDLMLYADGELEGERLAEVEAWIQSSADARSKLASLGLVSDMVREHALDGASRADDVASSVMGLLDQEVPRAVAPVPMEEAPKLPVQPVVANDNGRRFFFVAAGLLAVAAASLLWLRPAPGPVATPQDPSAMVAPPEADLEHGVEVASIDFGSTTGAVFYVPNGTSPSDTTTVVWLSDDADGEEE
jgi:anti-sigma factor RsiW